MYRLIQFLALSLLSIVAMAQVDNGWGWSNVIWISADSIFYETHNGDTISIAIIDAHPFDIREVEPHDGLVEEPLIIEWDNSFDEGILMYEDDEPLWVDEDLIFDGSLPYSKGNNLSNVNFVTEEVRGYELEKVKLAIKHFGFTAEELGVEPDIQYLDGEYEVRYSYKSKDKYVHKIRPIDIPNTSYSREYIRWGCVGGSIATIPVSVLDQLNTKLPYATKLKLVVYE